MSVSFVVFLLGLGFISLPFPRASRNIPKYETDVINKLLLGEQARAKSTIQMQLEPSVEFDFKTRDEVISSRKASVAKFQDLALDKYEPSPAVFGQIEDELPWWGEEGLFRLRTGMHPGPFHSRKGKSWHSNYVLNPLLLVAGECIPCYTCGSINRSKLSKVDFSAPGFPFQCQATDLQFSPKERRGEVTYDFTRYAVELKPKGVNIDLRDKKELNLITYNARDLGFNHMALSLDESSNISHTGIGAGKVNRLRQFIHRGGSCRYPIGCNNYSPQTPAWDNIEIDEFPAKAVFKLWREKPDTPEAEADFTFVINVR